MTNKATRRPSGLDIHYDAILGDISGVIEAARRSAARSVNCIMTAAYWMIGRRIVEFEQSGRERAGYGEDLLVRLATDLTAKFGRGFAKSNLYQMRAFYLAYTNIFQTVSGESDRRQIPQTPSTEIQTGSPLRSGQKIQTVSGELSVSDIARRFPLPWSAYVRLLGVKNDEARKFYETEALRGGWSMRQLDRQINSQFYERTSLSRDKAAMLRKGGKALPEDHVRPEEEIKDPYVLEFLGLRDKYSETDLEEALIRRLETFLLELGSDFCFIDRQKRLRIGDEWYRVNLLFFHRRLRCLVIIDLKVGRFTHADAGQIHLYLNYACEHWVHDGENPPVGLILCAQKDEAVARYALEGLPSKVMAAEYRMALPDEKQLAAEIDRARAALQKRGQFGPPPSEKSSKGKRGGKK